MVLQKTPWLIRFLQIKQLSSDMFNIVYMTLEILNGEYEGYYSYGAASNSEHKMLASFMFTEDGKVSGAGYDDVNTFQFHGNYDLHSMTVKLTKVYPTHSVRYTGVIESHDNQVSISGIWSMKSVLKSNGGFTLRKGAIKSEVMEDIDQLERSLQESMGKLGDIGIHLFD